MSADDLKARRFGQHTPDELERARAFAIAAIETYGDFDAAQWAQFHAHGIWNDHAAVQSALAAIMTGTDRIATLEAEVERLRAYARKASIALMRLSGGGSEMFTQIGDEHYAEPDLCAQRAEERAASRERLAALKDTDHANQENPDAE